MALNSIPAPQMTIVARDDQLQRSVFQKARAIGRAFADEWKDQMILLVRQVIAHNPPSSGEKKFSAGEQVGRAAIARDLSLMGFVPVTIKGFRTITHVPAGNVKGRKAVAIAPVTVATKLNPKFSDPDAF